MRKVFVSSVFVGCVLVLCVFHARPVPAALPNIVLLMGDDHGWEETGYNGHPSSQNARARRDGDGRSALRSLLRGSPLLLAHARQRHDRTASESVTAPSPPIGRSGRKKSPSRSGCARRVTLAAISASGTSGRSKADSPTNPGAMGFDEWLSHDNFFELNPDFLPQWRTAGKVRGGEFRNHH